MGVGETGVVGRQTFATCRGKPDRRVGVGETRWKAVWGGDDVRVRLGEGGPCAHASQMFGALTTHAIDPALDRWARPTWSKMFGVLPCTRSTHQRPVGSPHLVANVWRSTRVTWFGLPVGRIRRTSLRTR